jgi:hypothetical protein
MEIIEYQFPRSSKMVAVNVSRSEATRIIQSLSAQMFDDGDLECFRCDGDRKVNIMIKE